MHVTQWRKKVNIHMTAFVDDIRTHQSLVPIDKIQHNLKNQHGITFFMYQEVNYP
jgi:hypothetical protein